MQITRNSTFTCIVRGATNKNAVRSKIGIKQANRGLSSMAASLVCELLLLLPGNKPFSWNWIPTAEQQLKIFPRQIQLHMQSSTNKLAEAYVRCQAVFVSHLQEVQDFVDPYFQRAKKHLEPSINWIASIMKSHVEEAYLFFKDGKNPLCAFNKFFNSVQAIILETLERHETSKPLATKYLVWFMATVLLLSPILLLYKFFSAAFGKNWRTRRKTRISHASRKQKSKQAIKGSRVC